MKRVKATFIVRARARVTAAFGLVRARYEWFTWNVYCRTGPCSANVDHQHRQVAVMPHTSGLVQWWNNVDNRAMAEAFFADVRNRMH